MVAQHRLAVKTDAQPTNYPEHALSYAAWGWRVFPLHSVREGTCTCGNPHCSSPAKHPHTEHGVKDATTDPEQIRTWWTCWPDANIGIATGRDSNLLVIDVDPRHGGSIVTLGEMPETARVRTGGGGWHFYFRFPAETTVRNDTTGKLGAGIDVKSDGGYVVAPESIHASGQRYVWEHIGTTLELPQHLLERVMERPRPAATRREQTVRETSGNAAYWLTKAVHRVERNGHGRNDTGLWLACQLRDNGIEEDEAEQVMMNYVAQVADQGDHDYTEREAMATLTQAFRNEPREPANRVRLANTLPQEVEFTDTGNAIRLARDYAHRLKYVPQWGWLAYVNGKWERDGEGEAVRCAQACIQDLLREAAETEERGRRDDLLDHARRSFAEPRIRSMLKLAQSQPSITAKVEDFDANPWLLNVKNGTLDLQTGELRPHRPADLITKIAPVAFDPQAMSPLWEHFLGEVFRADTALVAFVQRALGYSMTGVTREQVFFICYGAGSNGKSTMLGAVAKVLGDYASPVKADALMAHRLDSGATADPEIAALVGARLVAAQEPKSGTLDTAKIKELTGGDTIQVREMYKMPFKFTPQFKLWLSTNELPDIPEATIGIWRRIRQIPFTVNFQGREDKSLPEKLAAEASGILNWLLAGLAAWRQEGLGTAEAVQEATRTYRENEDPYLEFFEEVLVADPESRVLLADAYKRFEQWAREASVAPLSDKEFPKRAEGRGYHKKRANGKRWLIGCRFASAASAAFGSSPQNSLMREEYAEFPQNGPRSTLPALPTDPHTGTSETIDY